MMKTLTLVTIVLVILSRSDCSYHRKSRFGLWPAGLVRFPNSECSSLEGYLGTCYTKRQCSDTGGSGTGTCANGVGRCCVFIATCGATASFNNTYFTNPGYPGVAPASASCTLTITKCYPEICQLRLDFLNFNLAPPDGNGLCTTDSLVVRGGASNVPPICGLNTGEHLYVNFNGDSDISLIISVSSAIALARSWNIKVTQLACDCPSLAPTGCLMYYTALSGTVTSFNYDTTISGAVVDIGGGMTRPGTRELANLDYGVCVQMQPGYCSIQWSQGADDVSFTVSGNTALDAVPPPGLPSDGMVGTNCTTDFVVIPDPSYVNGSAVLGDRFCGNQFPTVISSSKPFVLTVVTDGNDLTDVANRGFTLNYQQLPCNGALNSLAAVG